MSIGDPFLIQPLSHQRHRWEWRDFGTGGGDWSYISANTVPEGYARLGDVVYRAYIGDDDIPNPNIAFGVSAVYVRTDRPDAALPATGFDLIRDMRFTRQPATLWRPNHKDPNYISIGDVVVRGPGPPAAGRYYCVHRRFLVDAGRTAPLFSNDDGHPCFRTVASTNLFRVDNNQAYGLRDYAAIQDCCTGFGSNCENLQKGSVPCLTALMQSCKAADVKPGAKCAAWCERDPISCDKAKLQYCTDHPDDPLCDCINAFSRADHKELIKGREEIYSMSLPACYYDKCKLGPHRVFTTTDMTTAQLGQRCSQDLKYIDQRIKVEGEGNILNTNQSVQETTNTGSAAGGAGTNAANSKEKTILGISINTMIIILIAVVVIAVFGYFWFGRSNPDDAAAAYTMYMLQQQQQQMSQMPMMQMPMAPMANSADPSMFAAYPQQQFMAAQ